MNTLAALAALSLSLPNPFGPAAPPSTPPPPTSAADWRTPDPENILVMETTKGRILIELSPEVAPKSVERIKTLTRQGFYDGRGFFRVIDDFMAQTGDPTDKGTMGSTLPDLEPEFDFRRSPASTSFVRATTISGTEIGFIGAMPVRSQPTALAAISRDGQLSASTPFCSGVLGLARTDNFNTANSQFYMMRQDTHSLDKMYTAFGRVVSGLGAIRAFKTGEPVTEPMDRITSAKLLADLPAATRPKIRLIEPKGPWFTAQLKARVAREAPIFDPCAVDIPALVS